MKNGNKKRIALVVGTRPEVVKMAPVYRAISESTSLSPVLISTGQHRQMLDQAFAVFGLKPDIDFNLMQPGQGLPELTARVMTHMSQALQSIGPAAVLLQGDTTTVLASALAAFYQRIPIGHVEAGLRTYDYAAPWPEEMNRRLTDPISRWCFAPTDWSANNLLAEHVPAERVHVTGNTVVDALFWVRERSQGHSMNAEELSERCQIPAAFCSMYLRQGGVRRRWVLITGHRRESFGDGFENICRAITELSERYPDIGLLYPVHMNPNVQEPVRRILGGNPRVALIPPVTYADFIWLMERCDFVLSDSGGVQEEAPSLGKPVLVMRETTERPEGVRAGTCVLVGTDPNCIIGECARLLDDPGEYRRRSQLANPYGDGRASIKIRTLLEADLTR
ncbi:MAG: UDP-N-acetylglucosamine 2-epimerase (non-hydrolyzing) [Dechloromonas sp.]|nr:MAG: UDP-N-acetylglucosamine 2-epimerase (non-hydrolyzing) [Dechloromonas sp.]